MSRAHPGRTDPQAGDDTLHRMRHSAAHLLAEAVQSLFPEARLAIGPPVADGFSYDIDLSHSLSPEDMVMIEQRMRELQSCDEPFVREIVSREEAIDLFRNNVYKIEIISEIPIDEPITTYTLGTFRDLCRGPHVESTGRIGPFKLQSVAGAYWRGDEHRPMLQRIYGTAWPTQEELDAYLARQEEARQRDHRRLGPQLELFFFHPSAPGMPYWLPSGVALLDRLTSYWRDVHRAHGYQEIVSPMLNRKELFETSGHWEHYRDDMFVLNPDKNEAYGLKPMNCPNAMIAYGFRRRSYRELPLRFSDLDTLHRYERSGTLNGLLRARQFRQDDAHIFVTPDQIEGEFLRILDLVDQFYNLFVLHYSFRLGTRPSDFMGDIESWDRAEEILERILRESGRTYFVEEGDGAFYGPKIDILMQDALGREWQMGTLQLDFQIPRKFELDYAAKDGTLQTPITIHRAIYGSLERFVGILVEHFNGAFPAWLAPEQVRVIPITGEQVDYAHLVAEQLRAANVSVTVGQSSDRLQAKIRAAQAQKVPWMLIVGKREAESGTVAVRLRSGEDLGAMPIGAFLSSAVSIIDSKSLDLKSVS